MNEQFKTQKLDIGIGNIGPAKHIANGEYDWRLVDQLTHDLLNDQSLYERGENRLPRLCADGRTRRTDGGSAIGGSFSAVIADSLGPRLYYANDITAKQHALTIYAKFRAGNLLIGGHDDDHADAANSGCGGEDRLDSKDPGAITTLQFLSQYGDSVRRTLQSLCDTKTGTNLGVKVDDSQHDIIVSHSRELHARTTQSTAYVTCGADLRDALVEAQDDSAVERLHGLHTEAVLAIDFRNGMRLNRGKVAARYGDKLNAFYVNVDCLNNMAKFLYDDAEQTDLSFVSALYFNIATTAVLADKSLRVITLT